MGSLSLFTLAACVSNDDNSEWNDGSQAIKFTSSIKGLGTRAIGTEWTAGDQIGIFMKAADGELSAATAPNKLYTTDAQGNLTVSDAANALYYPTDGSSVDFVAYYPYTTSLDGITYKVDVTTQADLLYSNNAEGFDKTASTNPQLQFAHMLSQIVFNIEKDATIPSLTGLKVTFKGMNTKANFALTDGTLNNAGTVADIVNNLAANATTISTIVLPATALSGVKVTFELNGKSYTADYPQTVLDSGSKYTHKVSLSDSNGQPVITMGAAAITDWIEVSGDDIDVDFGGGTVTPPSDEVEVTESAPYTEAFTTGQGKFTIEDVTVPSELVNGVWVSDPQFGMKASAYAGATYASESWLVSPVLNLEGATKATLTFQHAINQTKDANFTTYYSLLAKKEGETTWTELTMTFPATESWTFISGGDIDLSAYAGGNVQFAFKYTSTASNAGTWEIKDLKVTVGDGGGDTPPPAAGNLMQNPGFETWTATLPTAWDNNYNTGEIVKSTDVKHSGSNALRQTSASSACNVQQEIAVVAGKTYRISYWFLDNDANARTRMWTYWTDGSATIADNLAEFRPNDYSTDNGAWQQVSFTLTAPATANKLRFEVRTYRESTTAVGGYIYYDDFEVVEVTQ